MTGVVVIFCAFQRGLWPRVWWDGGGCYICWLARLLIGYFSALSMLLSLLSVGFAEVRGRGWGGRTGGGPRSLFS